MKLPFLNIDTDSASSPVRQKWVLAAKTFIEPRNITSVNDEKLNRIALTGETVFLFQSEDGTEFRKEVCEGLEQTPLERLLDKVDSTGPEYIIRGDKRYVLTRYVEPPKAPVVR